MSNLHVIELQLANLQNLQHERRPLSCGQAADRRSSWLTHPQCTPPKPVFERSSAHFGEQSSERGAVPFKKKP
jgi:hypothetical protein